MSQPQAASQQIASNSGNEIAPGPPIPRPARERRASAREAVDAAALLVLVKSGSCLHGRIADLSLGGCCLHLDEPFPLGIWTRSEVEFRLQGQPFRLGGVVQGICDKRRVGIRFLDVSERKQRQIAELIAELHARRARIE